MSQSPDTFKSEFSNFTMYETQAKHVLENYRRLYIKLAEIRDTLTKELPKLPAYDMSKNNPDPNRMLKQLNGYIDNLYIDIRTQENALLELQLKYQTKFKDKPVDQGFYNTAPLNTALMIKELMGAPKGTPMSTAPTPAEIAENLTKTVGDSLGQLFVTTQSIIDELSTLQNEAINKSTQGLIQYLTQIGKGEGKVASESKTTKEVEALKKELELYKLLGTVNYTGGKMGYEPKSDAVILKNLEDIQKEDNAKDLGSLIGNLFNTSYTYSRVLRKAIADVEPLIWDLEYRQYDKEMFDKKLGEAQKAMEKLRQVGPGSDKNLANYIKANEELLSKVKGAPGGPMSKSIEKFSDRIDALKWAKKQIDALKAQPKPEPTVTFSLDRKDKVESASVPKQEAPKQGSPKQEAPKQGSPKKESSKQPPKDSSKPSAPGGPKM